MAALTRLKIKFYNTWAGIHKNSNVNLFVEITTRASSLQEADLKFQDLWPVI